MLIRRPSKNSHASEAKVYGSRQIKVTGILHLIALKLHATRTWDRAVQGKDHYNILNIILIHKSETSSQEFLEILNLYATESIRKRLLSDLKRLI